MSNKAIIGLIPRLSSVLTGAQFFCLIIRHSTFVELGYGPKSNTNSKKIKITLKKMSYHQ